MAGLGIEQDLGSSMPELVGGKADACLIPEGLFNLPPKACTVFRFAVPPREEVGVMAGCEVRAPFVDIGFDAFADACWRYVALAGGFWRLLSLTDNI